MPLIPPNAAGRELYGKCRKKPMQAAIVPRETIRLFAGQLRVWQSPGYRRALQNQSSKQYHVARTIAEIRTGAGQNASKIPIRFT
jgi:hypothetical protein